MSKKFIALSFALVAATSQFLMSACTTGCFEHICYYHANEMLCTRYDDPICVGDFISKDGAVGVGMTCRAATGFTNVNNTSCTAQCFVNTTAATGCAAAGYVSIGRRQCEHN